MRTVYAAMALSLLLTIVIGLAGLMRSPGRAASLLSVLLFGTTGVALVLVAGAGLGLARASDVALVFALLAAVLGVAFVRRGWPDGTDAGEEGP
jgi:multicomponent Na+:H+ antiporter subunit F